MKRPPTRGVMDTALNLLSRRDHSQEQLKRKLLTRGYEPEEISAALTKLAEMAYLDDLRFARALVRERLTRRGAGLADARKRLKLAGVSEAIAQTALVEAAGETDESELCRNTARKKTRELERAGRFTPERLARYLQSKGFPAELIYDVLRELRHDTNEVE